MRKDPFVELGCRPSRFVRLTGWGNGNVVQPEGSVSASSGWSFGSEAAWRVLVSPSGSVSALPVESHQFRRKGGDIRFAGPAQASWPEAATRGVFFLRAGGVRQRHPCRAK